MKRRKDCLRLLTSNVGDVCEENQSDQNTNEEVLTPGKRKKYIESDEEKTMENYESRFYAKNYTT